MQLVRLYLYQMSSKPHNLRLCSTIEAIKMSVVEWQFACDIIDLQITNMYSVKKINVAPSVS